MYNDFMDIAESLKNVPASPGVYIMKDQKQRVLYVGKAKNLRSRMRSYFQKSAALDDRKSRMVSQICDYDYIVAGNELEALALEASLIKKNRPPYNVVLRDDKSYPYIRLTIKEKWPRIEVVRRIEKDGAAYFGPYIPSGIMWEMLKFIRRNFGLRTCRHSMEKPFRPCVQYQMNKCIGPCSSSLRTDKHHEAYLQIVSEVEALIRGEKVELTATLRKRMYELSAALEFEQAGKIRDTLQALQRAWESQRVVDPGLGDADVIGIYREKQEAAVFVLFIRNGTVTGQRDFFLPKLEGIDTPELIEGFLEQFYSRSLLLPPRVILPIKDKFSILQQWLTLKREGKVRLSEAVSSAEKSILNMANENALHSYNRQKEVLVDQTLIDIREMLKLQTLPRRIAAMDISNISGAEAVGAVILYEDGKFRKDDYRLFKIKTVKGANDFAMIGEVTGRYMKNTLETHADFPDLILVDGGKGQISAALEAMKPFDLQIAIAGIAKARSPVKSNAGSNIIRDQERIYLPGRGRPLYLQQGADSTHLLQRIRDEVHRTAIGYHRKLRSKRTLHSPLEDITGIGKTRRLLLLKHFGSLEAIRKATLEELTGLKGMNRKAAEILREALSGSGKNSGQP